MEAPKCKICDERHYGMCMKAETTKGGKTVYVVIPAKPVITSPIKQKAKKKEHRLITAAKEAAVIAKGEVPIGFNDALKAIFYNPDGTINEAAARAGYNAYMMLKMRKHRAAKKEESK